ncbi:MAG: hypothetical protein Kow0074_13880 [Candidatus Zixiibacteriota bacterium]
MKMADRHFVWLALLLLSGLIGGCGSTVLRQGASALEEGQYDQAIAYFQTALEKDPADVRALSGLGRALYHQKKYAEAETHLAHAQSAAPENGLVALYLGLSRERQENLSGAEAAYETYLATNPSSKHARPIRGRLMYLRNEKLRQQAREAVRLEQSLSSDTSGLPTVAVLPFALTGAADSLRPLGKGLAAAVTYDLFQVKSIRVLERLRLQEVINELKLTESGFVDTASAPRVGRLIGANHLINSSLDFIGGENVAVQSGIVEPADDRFKVALISEETFTRIWKIQKDITFAVLDTLGIELTPQERNAIEKIPTEKFPAFLAFSRGIEHLDRGEYDQANESFAQASALDPGFDQAKALEQDTELLIEGSQSIGDFETSMAAELTTDTQFDIGPADGFFYIAEPVTDPRTDDEPPVETGTTSVGGTIP